MSGLLPRWVALNLRYCVLEDKHGTHKVDWQQKNSASLMSIIEGSEVASLLNIPVLDEVGQPILNLWT